LSRPARPVTAEDLVELNKYLVENYGGGTPGVRYEDGVHSAAERPFTALFGQEQFPEPEDKAAALMESIIRNHCFHDGNKRMGLNAGMGLYEELTGAALAVRREEGVRVSLLVAGKRWDFDRLSAWFARKGREAK
jgi:death-on-curing protein